MIGASGSGKSTMLRCIAGLELITDGEIRVEDVPVQQATHGKPNRGVLKAGKRVRSEVGMVFQNFNLFPHMTVLGNITLAVQAGSQSPARTKLSSPASNCSSELA